MQPIVSLLLAKLLANPYLSLLLLLLFCAALYILYTLLSKLMRYLDEKNIDIAEYIPFTPHDFFTVTGLKNQYLISEETEKKFKEITAKYIKQIGEEDYIHKSVKEKVEEKLSTSKFLRALNVLIDHIKKRRIYEVDGLVVSKEETAEITDEYKDTIWKILVDEMMCGIIDDSSVFIKKEDFVELEKSVGGRVEKYADVEAEEKEKNWKKPEVKIKKEKDVGGRPKTIIKKEKLLQLNEKGWPTRKIAEELGISHTLVAKELKKLKEQQDSCK